MEYLGHSSLAATERYVKLLPQAEVPTPPSASTRTSLAPPSVPAGGSPEGAANADRRTRR